VAQTAALKVYVFSSGDSASDGAVKQALTDRGYLATLGISLGNFDGSSVQLSGYNTVVLLGGDSRIPIGGITALQQYLQGSGGLILDAPVLDGDLTNDRSSILLPMLPAGSCNSLNHTKTSLLRVDPAEPVFDDGIAASFTVSPFPYFTGYGETEACLTPATGSKILYYSQGTEETRPRPGVVVNHPASSSRAVVFSVGLRYQALQNADFRKLFANAVAWAGTQNQTTPVVPPNSVYVFRTGDASADTAVIQTLQARGYLANLGIRASEFDGSSVQLTGYQTVVALGGDNRVPTAGITALQKYLQGSGGLILDAPMMDGNLANDHSNVFVPFLPATTCNALNHSTTGFLRVDPAKPVFDDGVATSFNVALTPYYPGYGETEACLSPATGSTTLFYSQGSDETRPRPGVVVNQPTPTSRAVIFSVGIRYPILQSNDFQRLFANAVGWAGTQTPPPLVVPTNSVYVFRTGDSAADTAVLQALQERGFQANLGIRASEFDGTSVQLSDYQAVVALGGDSRVPTAGITALQKYLQGSGGLILDAPMMDGGLANDRSNVFVPFLPASTCNSLSHIKTGFLRVDPAEPVFDDGVASSFSVSLTPYFPGYGETEACLTPATDAKTLFYSQGSEETRPRSGVVINQPGSGTRIAIFSVGIRYTTLQSADFKRLFVNSVQWAGRIQPGPSLSVAPTSLTFTYSIGGPSPPAQSINVSTSDNSSVKLTASVTTNSGGSWLSVTPSSGTAPGTFSASVNPASLAAGTYTGEVDLTTTGTPLRVPATLNVTATAGPACGYSLSPVSESYPVTGGTGTIGVTTTPACSWSAASSVPWVTITSGLSGSGVGTVNYNVAANTGTGSRVGTLTVAGLQFAVIQPGTALSFLFAPNPITFRFTQGSTQTDSRIFTVYSSSAASFTLTSAGGSWLSATPISGNTPGSVIVTVNPTGLAAGNYHATISVHVPGASPADQTAGVDVTVDPVGPVQLGVDPTTISIATNQGGEPKNTNLQVLNRGGGSLTFTATPSGGNWLSVQPSQGSTTQGSPASLVVTADPRGLNAGSYSGKIVVATPDGQQVEVKVFVTVGAVKQTILLSQTGLTFTVVAGGGSLPAQDIGVLNTGEGLMQWSANASTLVGGSWLSASPTSGATDAASLQIPRVNVAVDATGLAPGEYHGLITVIGPAAINTPQLVSVLLRVLPPGSDPGPLVRPTGLIFVTSADNPSATSDQVLVSNLSSRQRTFTSGLITSDGRAGYSYLPTDSAVLPSKPVSVLIQSDPSGLSPGIRYGVLTLLFSDGSHETVSILSLLAPAATKNARPAPFATTSCSSSVLHIQFTSMRQDFLAVLGQPTTVEVKVVDDCGNLVGTSNQAGAGVTASFSNRDSALKLTHVGNGVWRGTWRPVNATSDGSVILTVTAFQALASNIQSNQTDLAGRLASGTSPTVTSGGVVHAATDALVPIAPGSLITIYGQALADGTGSATGPTLPMQLQGTQVRFGDKPAPLSFASAQQLNVQIPFEIPVNTQYQITVQRGNTLSVPESLLVVPAQPGIFTVNQQGTGQGVILKSDQVTFAQPGTPAGAGEIVVIYCTGLGPVSPPVAAGTPAPSPAAQTVNPVTVMIGGRTADVKFAGLTPGSSGLYQINAVVPSGVTPGDTVPVTLQVAGQTSPPVTMAVQ
jgi:uncharacterized protein (TIGR03437 family)